MEQYLSLSGERPSPGLPDLFDGIGMIRAEYIMRGSEEYITLPACQARLSAYVEEVARAFAPRPVWLRQSDMTTLEVNTLRGADEILLEKEPLMGLRGLRRGLRFPDTMRLEVGSVLDVARHNPNLHYLFCYVTDADEFEAGAKILRDLGWPNRIGTMVEIPSAAMDADRLMGAGATNLLLGTNDMTSLLTGQQRRSDQGLSMSRALWSLARDLRRRVPAEVGLGIAGYLTAESMSVVRDEGFDYYAVHYADAPAVLGLDPELFPEREHMRAVKTLTKTRVAEWQQRHYRDTPATPLSPGALVSLSGRGDNP